MFLIIVTTKMLRLLCSVNQTIGSKNGKEAFRN